MTCVPIDELPPPPPGLTGWPWTEGGGATYDTEVSSPVISIVTPSFNQGLFLEQTIRSVLLQSYPKLEYFVIDGDSSDSTLEILNKYDRFLDGWVSEEDQGQSDAINNGFTKCRGEFFNWLCSDDFLLPEALWSVAETVAEKSEEGLYIGAGRNVDKEGRMIYERWNTEVQIRELIDWIQNWFFQSSAFFRREIWETNQLDVTLHYAMDLDFYLRAARKWGVCLVPSVLSCAREHDQSKGIHRRAEFFGEIALVQARHGGSEIVARDVARLQKAIRTILHSWPSRLGRRFLPPVDLEGLE